MRAYCNRYVQEFVRPERGVQDRLELEILSCHVGAGNLGPQINDDVWKNFETALQLKENPMVM